MLKITLYTLTLAGLALLLFACPDDVALEDGKASAGKLPTEQAILGTWETVEIEVDYESYGGGDTTAHELIKEADFGQLYGAKPPRTVFTPDGKLRRTHRFKDGRVSDVVNGLWKVHSTDTLLFIEPEKTLYFSYKMTSDRLELTGLTDSDGDKEVDDLKRTVLRLVARASYN